ncbi:MAG: hypothetical protein AAF441_04250 [Pseudomonadota bacterium]
MTIKRLALALPLLFAGWIATLASISLLTDEAPAQVVVFPKRAFLDNLPEGASIIALNDWSITLASPRPGFAGSLYRHGAWLVLPAGLRGCLPLPRR